MNVYTKRQYYVREKFYHNYSLGWVVFRDGYHLTKFEKFLEADAHAEKLSKQFGDKVGSY